MPALFFVWSHWWLFLLSVFWWRFIPVLSGLQDVLLVLLVGNAAIMKVQWWKRWCDFAIFCLALPFLLLRSKLLEIIIIIKKKGNTWSYSLLFKCSLYLLICIYFHCIFQWYALTVISHSDFYHLHNGYTDEIKWVLMALYSLYKP